MTDWSGFRPCTCIALDAEGYGPNNDRRQSEIQHDLRRLLTRAASGAGLDRSRWKVQQQGDGEVALIPQDENEPRYVDDLVRHMVSELRIYNEERRDIHRMRLRVALHHGPVELADNGFAGGAVVAVCRLLAADPLYEALRTLPDIDLALLLSDDLFQATVGAGHTTYEPTMFRRVSVRKKEFTAPAWLWTPRTVPASGRDTAALRSESGRAEAHAASPTVVNHIHGDVRGSVFGFGSPLA
ncbi:hypothetical protein [Streptacidiphilus jiangxiensis]|uniref:hypothetical protein n=1 Tax=Streptacidiphilus jiangxiensis TaxID=235985 RepID=UPI001F2BD64D|nr:hypothetical protein [Streptacidiphilus jiangxiensis]